MKKTKDIHHGIFRKSFRFPAVAPVAIAIASALILSGCSPEQEQSVTLYETPQQCIAANPSLESACNTAYSSALVQAEQTAPKYATKEDCVAEFGESLCVTSQVASGEQQVARAGSSFWMPMMAGYMMGRMAGGGFGANPLFTSNTRNSPANNKFVDSTGRSYGAGTAGGQTVKTDRSALAPKPATTKTITRGGFGQTVAKSSAASNTKTTQSTAKKSAPVRVRTGG